MAGITHRRDWAVASFVAAAALVASEVPVVTALLVIVLAVYQTFIGVAVSRTAGIRPGEISLFLGFALGSAVVVAMDQAFVALSWWRVGWLAPAILVAGLRRRGRPLLADRPRDVTVAVALTGVALGIEWYWSLIPGLFLLVTIASTMPAGRLAPPRGVAALLGASTAAVTVVEVLRRPRLWWLEHIPDYYLYENWSHHVARFGSRGVGLDGYGFSYHWYAYAWTGWLQRVVGDDAFIVTTRVAPVLFGVVFLGLCGTLARELGGGRYLAVGLLGVATYSTVNLWYGNSLILFRLESLNAVMGSVWLLGTVALVVRGVQTRSTRILLLGGLLAVFTLAAKSAFGLVAVAAVGLGALFSAVARRHRAALVVAPVVAALSAWVAWHLYLDTELPKYWRVSLGRFSFLWQTQAEKLQFSRWDLGVMAVVWINAALLPVVLAVIAQWRRSRDGGSAVVATGVVLAGVVGLCVLTLFLGNQIYFGYAILLALAPWLAASVSNSVDEAEPFGWRGPLLAILIGLLVSRVWPLLPHPPGASMEEIRRRDWPQYLVLVAALGGLVVALVRRRALGLRRPLIAFTLIATTAFSTATFAAEFLRERPRAYARWEREYPEKLAATRLKADEGALVASLASVTRDSDLIAFPEIASTCPEDPWGAGYGDPECIPARSWSSSTDPTVFAARVPRRLLIRTVHPLAVYADAPLDVRFEDLDRARRAMRQALEGDTADAMRTLRDLGVDYVVLPNSPRFATLESLGVAWSNDSYLLVRLAR